MKMVKRAAIKWMLAIVLSGIVIPSFATIAPIQETYSNLLSVNKNWEGLFQEINYFLTPNSEQELIQLHLVNVIGYLEEQSSTHLDSIQQQNRINNISILRSYCLAGEYPVNDLTTYRTPIFIDSKGVHCAVGHILKENGLATVAQDIANNQLLAFLGEIKHTQLIEWQKTCGLSMFELALIQPTYGPPIPICASESPIEWKTITVNSKITQFYNGANNTIYGIANVDELGLNQEILLLDVSSNEWKSYGPQMSGEFLGLTFCNGMLYANVFLPFEKFPHQLMRLKDGKWDKVAHFNGSIIAMEVLQNKLYVNGRFTKVNDNLNSNFVVIEGSSIKSFTAIGHRNITFDHMKASESALFMTAGGGVYKFKNDSIKYLTSIQYYSYITNISLDAWMDTLYVSSLSIQGYNKYYDQLEHPTYMNNMLYGQDYPYSSVFFTKSQKVKGRMIIAGDFRTSTMSPQVNDERVLIPCADTASAHWYGEGLLYEYENLHYPILNKGIVLDFTQLQGRIYVLKKDGSICFSELDDIDKEIAILRKRGGL